MHTENALHGNHTWFSHTTNYHNNMKQCLQTFPKNGRLENGPIILCMPYITPIFGQI